MVNKATEKLKNEMEKCKNPNISKIGETLIECMNDYPEIAENIIVDGKSLEESYRKVYDHAKAKAYKQCALLEGDEIMKIVFKYYEIKVKIGNVSESKKMDHEEDMPVGNLLKMLMGDEVSSDKLKNIKDRFI